MTSQAAVATSRSATAHKQLTLRRTLWVLQILIAAFLLLGSAMPKFVGQKDAIDTFAQIGWGQWLRYVTGTAEAAGALGLVVPRLAGLAATGLTALMFGAILTHVVVLTPMYALLPAVLAAIFVVIVYDRRTETKTLLRSLQR
ncbi:DoxX family protein [Actinacidiphila glaucinigra]|uniref:DoxX family protein n=1 Tax=Actinacidiphila glaucinigra TaxID=235986 RepID=UPI0036C21C2F